MPLSRSDMVELAASIYGMIVAGEEPDVIRTTLGVTVDTYDSAYKMMLEMKSTDVREKPREHVYVEYTMAMEANIGDLDTLIKKLVEPGCRQANAHVGAIRLRADIQDRIMERGFDLGIIKKTPDQTEIIGGIAVAHMSLGDLRKSIEEQAGRTATIIGTFGEGDMSLVDAGEVYRGPTATEGGTEDDEAALDEPDDIVAAPKVMPKPAIVVRKAPRPATAKARTSAVHGGRPRTR